MVLSDTSSTASSTRTGECPFCHASFQVRGLANHMRHCPARPDRPSYACVPTSTSFWSELLFNPLKLFWMGMMLVMVSYIVLHVFQKLVVDNFDGVLLSTMMKYTKIYVAARNELHADLAS